MKNLFFYFSMFFLSTNFLFAETNPADTCKSKNQNAIASENLCLEEENFFTGTTEFKAKQEQELKEFNINMNRTELEFCSGIVYRHFWYHWRSSSKSQSLFG